MKRPSPSSRPRESRFSIELTLAPEVVAGFRRTGGSAIEGDRPIPFVVPPAQLATIVVLAAFAGVLAAVGAARRAAKLDILAAIASH